MSKMIISPSILSADFANLGRDVKKVAECGADWIHIDVMDGHFVPNITIGAPVVKAIRNITDKVFDVHLMIENPERYIKDFADAGADIITFHYEAVKNDKIIEIADYIKSFGLKAGLSIKPKTPAEDIFKYLEYFDLILVMTVEPGFGGQKFMKDCAQKLRLLKRNAPEGIYLQVDGGINAQTARVCAFNGANSLVAGSYIFNSENMKSAIDSLREASY